MRYLLLCVFLFGCTSNQHAINHVVFIELADSSHVQALIEDSNKRLATIPSVKEYFCGTHVPSGRATVLTDYDVGLYVAFDSMEGYQAYVEHPGHVNFVNKWKPKMQSLRVYDISGD